MQPTIIKVKPKDYIDSKPGKYETLTFFRVCSSNCPKCDTKRTTCCKKK